MGNMDKTEILETIQDIVRDILGLDDLTLTPETTAKDVERWDSVSNIGIVMGIEQEYGFRFDLGELDALESVGDMVEAVIKHTQP